MCVVGVLLVLALSGKLLAQMVFDNKMAGDGAAEDGAENEAEGRRRNGDARAATAPAASRSGPMAAAVPGPPIMEMEPQPRP